jgi:hypothetical protein
LPLHFGIRFGNKPLSRDDCPLLCVPNHPQDFTRFSCQSCFESCFNHFRDLLMNLPFIHPAPKDSMESSRRFHSSTTPLIWKELVSRIHSWAISRQRDEFWRSHPPPLLVRFKNANGASSHQLSSFSFLLSLFHITKRIPRRDNDTVPKARAYL